MTGRESATSTPGEAPERADFLLKFGFGGVQPFIAQSRKTRDLAASSRLLSDLAQAAIAAGRARGAAPVWPAEQGTACPHQAVLRLEGKTPDDVRELGEAMREAVASEWTRRALPVLTGKTAPDYPAQTRMQLADTFETYWVAVREDSGYDDAYKQVSSAFEQRRFTRTFKQLAQEDGPHLRTCVQCGARAAVFLDYPHHPAFEPKDRMCSVCAAKRLWSWESLRDGFPSTPALARDRFFRDPNWKAARELAQRMGLEDDDWSDLSSAWCGLREWKRREKKGDPPVPAGPRAGSIRTLVKRLDGAGLTPAEETLLDVAIQACGRKKPYFALLAFDGDRMGEWFSGDRGYGGEVSLRTFQRSLSAALTSFASRVSREARSYRTRVAYAGGDDGLALLPLDCLLPFVAAILTAWDGEVKTKFKGTDDRRPTLSIHASVVHEHHPLSVAVAALHGRLDATKELLDGDAFSVWVEPRSGSVASLLAKNENDKFDEIVRIIEDLSTWRLDDMPPTKPAALSPTPSEVATRKKRALPARLPHQLLAVSAGFFDENGYCPAPAAFALEARRVLGRSGGAPDAPLVPWLVRRATNQYETRKGVLRPLRCDEATQAALSVLAFLARQLDWEDGS